MKLSETNCISITRGVNAAELNSMVRKGSTCKMTPRQLESKCCELMIQLRLFEYQLMESESHQLTDKLLSHEQWVENINIINACYNLLLVNVDYDLSEAFLRYSHIFEELNDRLAFYYRIINKNNFHQIANIKMIQVSEHHQAVEYVYREFDTCLDTIVSFDSHPDTNAVKDDLLFYRSCLTCKDFDYKTVHQLYQKMNNDCGAVLTPMLLPYERNQGVIWVYPEWFQASEFTRNAFIRSHDGISYLDLTNTHFDSDEDLIVMPHTDNMIQVKFLTSYIQNLLDHSQWISNQYILNIDLDYFVAYGMEVVHDELTEDRMSSFRTDIDFARAIKDGPYANNKLYELDGEIFLIKKRIYNLLQAVKTLKAIGKLPSLIIVCDSTRVDFSSVSSHWHNKIDLLGMEFTPKYLVFWLRQVLLEGLQEVLG